MPDELPAGAARDWAAAQLDLNPTCSFGEIRRAFWARLATAEFAAHGRHIEAIDLLQHPADEPMISLRVPQFRHDFERSLDAEIAAFAQQFFALRPWQRQQQWFVLTGRAAACPRQLWRLNCLKDGLTVDFQRLDDHEQARRIAAWCGEWFVSPPPARSARKLEILSEVHESDNVGLIRAARQLQALTPEIAQLAPELVGEMANPRQAKTRRARRLKRLARRQTWYEWQSFVLWSTIVVMGVIVWFALTKHGARTRPDRLQPPANVFSNQNLSVETIDAEELLSSEDPWRLIASRVGHDRIQVRASAEQVSRLREKLGDPEFRIFFGDGMAELVESDKPAPPVPDEVPRSE